jgi:hypothetical protein
MKKLLTLALTFVAVALFTVPAIAQVPGGRQPIPRPKVPPIVLCMDPAAQSLTFQVLSGDSRHTDGRIRITGVVKNVGNRVFESDPRQATVAIYETHPGERQGTIKAQQSIARLAPNATITLTFERPWSLSAEFPPTFALMITYDPDIYLDANKNNDDCNRNNNKKELSGDEINRRWLPLSSTKTR